MEREKWNEKCNQRKEKTRKEGKKRYEKGGANGKHKIPSMLLTTACQLAAGVIMVDNYVCSQRPQDRAVRG